MSIRKRKWASGEAWVVDYFSPDAVTGERKRHNRTFSTKKEATEWWEAEGAPSVRRGTHTARSTSKTVAEAAEAWIERCESGTAEFDPLEPATVREYRGHVDRYINHPAIGIGNRKLADLRYGDVVAFDGRIRAAGKTAATVRKVRVSLSALLSDAMQHGMVGKHVIRDGQRTRRTKRKDRKQRKIEMPTRAELNTLISKADDNFRPFVVTAIFTGMRASELRGLTWDNVDLDAGVIHVRQRADRYNTMGDPKTQAGTRDIPMAPLVKNTLREWKLRCPRHKDGEGEGKLWLVFPNGSGNVEALGNIYKRAFAPLQIDNGMGIPSGRKDEDGKPILRGKYGFHALRHAAASMFIEQGFTPKKLQALMGHANISLVFDTYGHLFKDAGADEKAFAQIQARLVG